jgi:hypothetical protein
LGSAITGQRLIAHPASPNHDLVISCDVRRDGGALMLDYTAEGAVGALLIPQSTAPARRDGLWRHTCFEAFVMPADAASYAEYNFSPSGQWAAYRFASYRRDGADLPVNSISIASSHGITDGRGKLKLSAAVALPDWFAGPIKLALSVVIEVRDGSKSYWALHHAPGNPDFHHPDCFTLLLEAPDAA